MSKKTLNIKQFMKNTEIYNIINKEKGYNVLAHQNGIKEPPLLNKRNDIYFINYKKNLVRKFENKQNLVKFDIKICENSGYGNCYYKVLSQFFYKTEIYHIYFRKEIASFYRYKKK